MAGDQAHLLILDEPTQGIDVQTKAEVHAVIADLARQGLAIILISSELPELLGMCDRIVVLREGRVTAEFPAAEATQERVLYAMTDAGGSTKPAAEQHTETTNEARPAVGWLRRLVPQLELGLLLAVPVVLLAGAAAGAFNGILVTRLDLPSLVVTLGTLAMFRGIGYIILGSNSVNQFPDVLTELGIENVAGTAIPWTLVPFLVLAPIFAIVLQHTPTGRRIYAIGGNPDAALYAGVRSRRLRFMLFVVSGLVCAVAGIVFTARLANARANNALGFELDVITIALLGGISVFGGRDKLTGVLWALVLVATLRNVLGLLCRSAATRRGSPSACC